MGLLRIAALGALGYIAYRALQSENDQTLDRGSEADDTDTTTLYDTSAADKSHWPDDAPRPY